MFAGNFAPRNWAFCQGQTLPISGNEALFSIIGTIYGGDGRTTFKLPDLRGRVPVGVGTGADLSIVSQGRKFGAETVTLATTNLPQHSHDVNLPIEAVSEVGDSSDPTNKYPANSGFFDKEYRSTGTKINTAQSVTGSTSSSGNNQSFNIQQPSIGINFIICINGIFPSRS